MILIFSAVASGQVASGHLDQLQTPGSVTPEAEVARMLAMIGDQVSIQAMLA